MHPGVFKKSMKSLVQLKAYGLFGTKHLPEPMVTCYASMCLTTEETHARYILDEAI